jgi:hypothetical protein
MTTFPVISPFIALPLAFVLMVVVALHARATRRSAEPASRKRVRLANASLMMLTLPLIAVGFSLLNPRTHRQEWLLVWLAAIALLGMNVLLAVIDAANTLRLLRAARRRIRASLTTDLAHDLRQRSRL